MGKCNRWRSGVARDDRGVVHGVLMVAGIRQLAAGWGGTKKGRGGGGKKFAGGCPPGRGENCWGWMEGLVGGEGWRVVWPGGAYVFGG